MLSQFCYSTEVLLAMKCVVVVVLALLQSVVRSQTFPYVSFRGQTLANHSYVDLSLVRDDASDSVQCHTDLTTCCSIAQGAHRGDWYFPDGNKLPFSGNIFESRGSVRADLRQRNNANSPSTGIYRCDIPTNAAHVNTENTVRESIYVGLYTGGGGRYITTAKMLFIAVTGSITFYHRQYQIICCDTDCGLKWSQSSVHPHLYLHWWTCYHCILDQRLHHCHH